MWGYFGCYPDSVIARTFSYQMYLDPDTVDIESCQDACAESNFGYAGLEYSNECYCNSLDVLYKLTSDNSKCDMSCAGNSTEICGGQNHLSVYVQLF